MLMFSLVPHTSAPLDEVFAALADPSRRLILDRLAGGEAKIRDVAEPLDMAAPSVSWHVKSLEEAGLIRRRIDGRDHLISLDPDGFRRAVDYLRHYERFWESSLRRLDSLVRRPETGEPND